MFWIPKTMPLAAKAPTTRHGTEERSRKAGASTTMTPPTTAARVIRKAGMYTPANTAVTAPARIAVPTLRFVKARMNRRMAASINAVPRAAGRTRTRREGNGIGWSRPGEGRVRR